MPHAIRICFVISTICAISHVQAQDDNTHKPVDLSWAIHQKQGNRKNQEDRYDVYYPHASNIAVFGVYDGHGGSDMSHALAHGYHDVPQLTQAIHDGFNPHNALSIKTVFENWEQHLITSCADTPMKPGSTATCAYCDLAHDTMYLFNLGDSRALVMIGEEEAHTTIDNTVRNEYQRVLNDGGTITNGCISMQQTTSGTYRITPKKETAYTIPFNHLKPLITSSTTLRLSDMITGSPSLIPSRAFGDYYRNTTHHITGEAKKPQGLVVHPDVYGTFKLSGVIAVILGTDGIWDTISKKQACQIIWQHRNKTQAASTIAQHITNLAYGCDNKTATVIIPKTA